MGRPSMSASSNRRPLWAKSALRYSAVINASTRAGKPGQDFGEDNYTYDPEKAVQWQMPENIKAENLPKELYEASKDWILAGSAIDTALERIQELSEDAAQRAFPSYTHEHLIASRRASEQDSSVGGASELELVPTLSSTSTTTSVPSTANTSFSQPQPPKLDTIVSTHSAKKNYVHPNQLPDSITSMLGMESPPFTPVTRSGSESGSGARSPAILPSGHKDTEVTPDFIKLSAQLSPLMSPSLCSFTSDSSTLVKVDTLAWNSYVKAYTAELNDLKQAALPRLRGYEQTIQKLLFELRANPPDDVTWQTAEAVFAFAAWWKEAKTKGQVRAQVATKQELPRVEEVFGGA